MQPRVVLSVAVYEFGPLQMEIVNSLAQKACGSSRVSCAPLGLGSATKSGARQAEATLPQVMHIVGDPVEDVTFRRIV